jgi:hypothetical protein
MAVVWLFELDAAVGVLLSVPVALGMLSPADAPGDEVTFVVKDDVVVMELVGALVHR